MNSFASYVYMGDGCIIQQKENGNLRTINGMSVPRKHWPHSCVGYFNFVLVPKKACFRHLSQVN